MTGNEAALLAVAAGVGFGHAILPDHWVPLAVLGRTRRYPLSRVARLSALAGVTHVLVSIILGAVIIVVGLQFRATIQHAQDTIVGLILISTGAAFALLELTGHGHAHQHSDAHAHHHHTHQHVHDHEHVHDHDHPAEHTHSAPPQPRLRGLAAVIVPFGAAASPDLTILPVFLAATAAGPGAAVASLLAFAVATIGTIVGLTLAASRGGYAINAQWLERRGNTLTALVLVIVGLLVLTGTI
jgi:ABC-type nickel/cobalt efflux system permease component RcnA